MQLKSLLKTKALIIITLLTSFSAFAQAPNLLNYQGVARNAVGNPLPNQTMKLRLSIHDLLPSGAVVYSEIRQITTNLGGLFSVQIGSAGASSSNGTLGGVNWIVGNKFLQVELDPASNNNYIDIGTVQLVSVPYAFGAGSAATVKTNANLTGVVTSVGNQTSIANGAITSDMIGTLNKSKVGLDLVNNTSDVAKPISNATQAALGYKLNIADSSTSYVTPAQLATKTFDQTPITNAIAGKLAIADSMNGYVTPAKLAAKTFDTTSLSNRINTKANDAAVTTALNLKANTSDLTAGLALKLDANKLGAANGVASLNASGIIPSIQLPPVTLSSTSVVASDAAMIALSSATVGSIAIRTDVNKNYVLTALPASTLGNWIQLLTPAAPVQAVNGYTGSVNLTKTDLGLSEVNNTTDLNKPISTATQNELNLKANKTDVDAALANKISTADATAALNLKANKTEVDVALANKISTTDATAALNLKANKTEVDAALANKISAADATAAFNLKLDANKVAAANGVASLNAQGKIPTDQIPAISFSSVKVLASEAEMLALSSAVIGSVVIRTDESKNYVLSQSNPAVRANWVQLLTPAAPVQSVNGKTGTVAISSTDLGLENVQNTSDADKVISTRTQTALDTKVDKVTGKNLSTNDYTTAEKTKLAAITGITDLASAVTGVLSVANGGTGAATLTGLVKGTGASALTVAVAGTDYQAPISLTTTGTGAATLSGTVLNIPTPSVSSTLTAGSISGTVAVANGGTGTTTLTGLIKGNGTSALTAAVAGTDYQRPITLTTTGTGAATLSGTTLNIPASDGLSKLTTTTKTLSDPFDFGSSTGFQNGPLDVSTDQNLATGPEVLKVNASGIANVGFGIKNLYSNTTGSANTSVGFKALYSNTSGQNNSSFGTYSLYYNTTGSYNSSFGSLALLSNTTGSANSAFGEWSMLKNTTGSNNTAYGANSLNSNTTGDNNSAIGLSALLNNTSGGNNSAVGYAALLNNTSGSNNVALGLNASQSNTTGNGNIALGKFALLSNTTGSFNTAIGTDADVNSNNLSNTIAIGYGARVSASNTIQLGADGNSYITNGVTYTPPAITNVRTTGTLTLGAVTYPNTHAASSGQVLTSLGSGTLTWTSASGGVSSVGSISGTSNVNGATISGTTLTLTPANASYGGIVTTGVQTFTGTKTFSTDIYVNGLTVGRGNSSKANNYAYGYAVLSVNTTGNYNNAFGHQALTANTTGQQNSAFGEYVLPKNIGGNYNTAMGTMALRDNTSGSGNTGFGQQALLTNSTGSNNTAIGNLADVATSALTNATAIGNGAIVSSSNTIQLGNAAVTNVNTSGAITAKNYVLTVPSTITAAATTTIDMSTGNIFKISLGANITTLTLNNITAGTFILEFIQDATGSRTVAFPVGWKWSGGAAPTITTTATKTDIVTIVYDGSTYFASAVQNF